VEIGTFLRQGKNTVTVEVATDRPDGGLLNPLYLAGEFGVELSPLGLVNRPPLGGFEQYTANKLPYYAGVVDYHFTAPIQALPMAERVSVRIEPPRPFHEACEVSFNGGPWHALPWGLYPLEVPTGVLREGKNDVAIRVYTTLIRSFEGQEFDDQNHRYRVIT
jgi:hypothetical protein